MIGIGRRASDMQEWVWCPGWWELGTSSGGAEGRGGVCGVSVQYYLKTGTCKFGATCKYHHPREKAGSTGRVHLNVLGLPLRLVGRAESDDELLLPGGSVVQGRVSLPHDLGSCVCVCVCVCEGCEGCGRIVGAGEWSAGVRVRW